MRYIAAKHFSSTAIGTYEPGEVVIVQNKALAKYFEQLGVVRRYEVKPKPQSQAMEVKPEPVVPLDRGEVSEYSLSPAAQASPKPKRKPRARKAKQSPSTTPDSLE